MPMIGATLGEEIFAAVNSVAETQQTSSESVSLERWKAIAEAIVNHIKTNATIAPLSTSCSPNDGPNHTHTVATTQSTGKIS